MGQSQSNTQLATNINFLANTIKHSRETPELTIQEALLRFHNDLLGSSILPDSVSDGFVLTGGLLFTGLLGLLYMTVKSLRRDVDENRRLLLKQCDKHEALSVSLAAHARCIHIMRKKDVLIKNLLDLNQGYVNLVSLLQVRILVFVRTSIN